MALAKSPGSVTTNTTNEDKGKCTHNPVASHSLLTTDGNEISQDHKRNFFSDIGDLDTLDLNTCIGS
jgi:hypothetical protein